MKNKARTAKLSMAANLPTEFRIFKPGWNPSSKGDYLFDDEAARLVMEQFHIGGVDIMIDREHLSLDDKAPNYDPDARAWCKLAVKNGELWAVDVKWTPDGAQRLNNRTQRYVSPVFEYEEKSKRITGIYNIAICAIPATHEAPALVAASKRTGQNYVSLNIEVSKMDELKKVAAALGLKEDATLEEILAAIKAATEEEEIGSDEPPEPKDKPKEKEKDEGDGDEAALSKLPPKLQARVMAALSTNEVLKTRVESIEKNQHKSEIETLMAANIDRIPLSMESWCKKQTPDNLREFLKHAAPDARPKEEKEKKRTDGAKDAELTHEDKWAAKLTGATPAQILEHKKKKLASA